jgi:hypothetical protein
MRAMTELKNHNGDQELLPHSIFIIVSTGNPILTPQYKSWCYSPFFRRLLQQISVLFHCVLLFGLTGSTDVSFAKEAATYGACRTM